MCIFRKTISVQISSYGYIDIKNTILYKYPREDKKGTWKKNQMDSKTNQTETD